MHGQTGPPTGRVRVGVVRVQVRREDVHVAPRRRHANHAAALGAQIVAVVQACEATK